MGTSTPATRLQIRGLGMIASLALGLAFALPAVRAQDQAHDAPNGATLTQTLDAVVVTGSAIPSADLVSEQPITIITAEQIRRSGAVSLQQFLSTIPAIGLQGVNNNQVSGLLNGSGNNFVDLRNLGPARTLVLIDGKRFPPSSNQTAEAVDIGNIPVSLIDHVEILRDGASPIYGSDAIGGVINVILRRHFEGLEVSSELGTSEHFDGSTEEVSALYGKKFGASHFVFDFEFSKSDPIRQSNRDWAHDAFLPGITLGTLQVSRSPDGLTPAKGTQCPNTGVSSDCVATGAGTTPGFRPANINDFYDLSSNNDLTIGQERISANALFDRHLTDHVSFYSEAELTVRRSDGQGSPAGFKSTTINDKYPTAQKISANAPGNPYGVAVALSELFPETGPAKIHGQDPAFRFVAGFRGDFLSSFHWDLSWLYGEDNDNLTTTNKINFTHALQELGDSRAPACASSPGCVPGDFFGPESLSPAAASYLLYAGTVRSRYGEESLDGTINGTLPGLPAGPVAVAVGGDYRRVRGDFTPDAVTLTGDQNGADTAPTAGSYDTREAFLEVKLPLLAGMPAAQDLELDGATRYSNYSNFGDALTWKLGLDWNISQDLRFRGSHTTGFRAPGITELFLGQTTISAAETDPCDTQQGLTGNPTVAANCATAGVPAGYLEPGNNYPTFLAGNPALKPETSQSWSAGLVMTPRFAPHASLTLDWYDIYIRNGIGRLDPNFILDQCYESQNLSSPFCSEIGARTGAASGAPGQLTSITDIEGNLGGIKTNGLDMVLHYDLPLTGLGLPGHNTLSLDNFGTWIFGYNQQTGVGSPYTHFAGTLDLPTSPTNPGLIAHYRDNAVLDVRHDNIDLAWTVQYIGSGNAVNPIVAPNFSGPAAAYPGNHVPDVVYHALAATWRGGPTTVTFGVNNLFDRNPPFWNDGTVNTNEFTYDTVGRFFYLNLKVRLGAS
jgi:outer membrane receptor protein involved in Fe transport